MSISAPPHQYSFACTNAKNWGSPQAINTSPKVSLRTKNKSIKNAPSDCCRLCMENPETSQNCSKFKTPWGNRPCFITSTGAGDSERGGGTHAKRHRKRWNSPTGCEGQGEKEGHGE